MKYDLCLKFADEAEAIKVLAQYRGTDENNTQVWRTASHSHAMDLIGTIYSPTGNVLPSPDPGGPDVQEMAAVPGYHINLQCEESSGLEAYIITPTHRQRVWA